jgi:leader peptidase (prepilin peptidase)/N-methyltransferase
MLGTYPFLPEMMPMWHLTVLAVGACIGSFLNVCIWRIPRGESVVSPPSHCPQCGHHLPWYENLPLISWLALRGRCRHCHGAISPRYLAVEMLTAAMFEVVWLRIVLGGLPLTLAPLWFMVTMLVILTLFIDAKHFIIPNEITYPAAILGLAMAWYWPQHWPPFPATRWLALGQSALGLVGGVGGLAIAAVIGRRIFRREALGWGDVKYLGAVGACLGLFACFFVVLIGSLFGSAVGLAMIGCRRKRLHGSIPFGPYLAVATWLWVLAGPEMVRGYLYWVTRLADALAGRG